MKTQDGLNCTISTNSYTEASISPFSHIPIFVCDGDMVT